MPQTASFLISATGLPVLAAIWLKARLWSRRSIAVKFFFGRLGALFIAMYAFVLAGLPTTSTLTLRLAFWSSALPWAVKIWPLIASSSARSMPALRGIEPTSKA